MAYDFRNANLNEDRSFVSLNGDSGEFVDENPFRLDGSLTLEYGRVSVIGGEGLNLPSQSNLLEGRLYFNEPISIVTCSFDCNISIFSDISYEFYYQGMLTYSISNINDDNSPQLIENEYFTFDSMSFVSNFDYSDFSGQKIASIFPYDMYQNGYFDGYNSGQNIGYGQGYNVGYNVGYQDGYSSDNSMSSLVVEVANTPLNIFKSIFDVDIMGFNLVNVCFGLISILLVVFIIKKFMGGE